ncbi:MAG: hypothetical protein IIZ78_03815 [Clostridiales bacterium]|nr:hypothetical protein [Clostridiales bacterium]
MSNKLIDFNALSSYKTQSDLKYQDKISAGTGITLTGTTISVTNPVQPVFYATVAANGWSGTSNAVTVQGVTASDNVEIVGFNPTGMTSSAAAAAKDALGLITYGDTSANTITFYALSGTVPSVDIPIILRKLV